MLRFCPWAFRGEIGETRCSIISTFFLLSSVLTPLHLVFFAEEKGVGEREGRTDRGRGEREGEREREREREQKGGERERERETDRQTDRQTDRELKTESERQTDRHRELETESEQETDRDRESWRQRELIDRQTDTESMRPRER